MEQSDTIRSLIFITTFESDRRRVIMDYVGIQLMGYNGVGCKIEHQGVSIAFIEAIYVSSQAVIVVLCRHIRLFSDAVEIIGSLFRHFV